jgi:hypothetical protein
MNFPVEHTKSHFVRIAENLYVSEAKRITPGHPQYQHKIWRWVVLSRQLNKSASTGVLNECYPNLVRDDSRKGLVAGGPPLHGLDLRSALFQQHHSFDSSLGHSRRQSIFLLGHATGDSLTTKSNYDSIPTSANDITTRHDPSRLIYSLTYHLTASFRVVENLQRAPRPAL